MTNAEISPETVRHYSARALWEKGDLDSSFATKIANAIIRDDIISIEWPPAQGYAAQTTLKRVQGNRFVGQSIWASGTSWQDIARTEGQLYSNELGHVLIGQSTWKSGEATWFVIQLSEIA